LVVRESTDRKRAKGLKRNPTVERHDPILSSNKKTSSTMKNIQSLDELSKRLPKEFRVGRASSAFQIEGAAAADGKGLRFGMSSADFPASSQMAPMEGSPAITTTGSSPTST